MTFATIAAQLFADYGQYMPLERMNEIDRRRLAAAYVRDDPSALTDILAGIRHESIAEHVATLMENTSRCDALDTCDAIDLAAELWCGIWPNKDLESLVEGELAYQWRRYCRERCNASLDQTPALAQRQAN